MVCAPPNLKVGAWAPTPPPLFLHPCIAGMASKRIDVSSHFLTIWSTMTRITDMRDDLQTEISG